MSLEITDARLLRERCYVNGEWVAASDGASFSVDDPARLRVIAHVPSLSADDCKAAIDAAAQAFVSWRDVAAYDRYRLLHRMAHLMRDHQADLACIMSLEQGKPLSESSAEIEQSARYYEWFAEEARRHGGELIPSSGPDQQLIAVREPIGVAGAITPWNFPASMVARKVAAALAAGCTMVLKPAEATPLSALAQAELLDRAGAPAGVINVITGVPVVVGAVLTGDARVRKLSFTGSTPVGRLLMQQCAPSLKRLSLELGGNAPFIVFADADFDAAVQGALASRLRNAGQTCVSANRILVQRSIAPQFVKAISAKAATWKMGRFDEPGVMAGPLINQAAIDKVRGLVDDAVQAGARLCAGGHEHKRGGFFWEPTVLADVTPSMRVAQEESFGPIAPILVFEDEAQALEIANATEYGLAAYVYTQDLGRCQRMQRGLEVGMVAFNQPFVASETAPFGGVKSSGYGREGSHLGLAEYQQVKMVAVRTATAEQRPLGAAPDLQRQSTGTEATPPRSYSASHPSNLGHGEVTAPYQPMSGPLPLPVQVMVEREHLEPVAPGMPQLLSPEPVRVDVGSDVRSGMPVPVDCKQAISSLATSRWRSPWTS